MLSKVKSDLANVQIWLLELQDVWETPRNQADKTCGAIGKARQFIWFLIGWKQKRNVLHDWLPVKARFI